MREAYTRDCLHCPIPNKIKCQVLGGQMRGCYYYFISYVHSSGPILCDKVTSAVSLPAMLCISLILSQGPPGISLGIIRIFVEIEKG